MIDELFEQKTGRFTDPRLQFWDNRLSDPSTSVELEIQWPTMMVGHTFPEMSVTLYKSGLQPRTEFIGWDDDLNELFVSRSVKAIDTHQEATRFALALRAAFKKAERDYNDGYFNSVFFAVLKENDLATQPLLSPLVREFDYIYNMESIEKTDRYTRCYEMIKSAIQSKASQLVSTLKYPLAEAKAIFVEALAEYIKRRFSVPNRH